MKDIAIPLIIEPSELEKLAQQIPVLPVAVCQARVFESQHIPGSVLIEPGELVSGSKPAVGKLPRAEQLSRVFSRIGLTQDTHIIAYDDEGGGWAGRLIWTLDLLGHQNYSYLNGGLIAWLKAGLPVESGPDNPQASEFVADVDTSQLRSKEDILSRLNNNSLVIWDARSREEFSGEKITALRNGHIPGAVNLDWLDLMDRDNDLRLQPMDVLRNKLQHLGIEHGKEIVTHCQTHHRSGLSYLVGKALALNIRAYDGSWSEWGNDPDTPIETGS